MRRRQQGFALLDATIAVAVFSLSAAGFVGFMLSSQALQEETHDRAQATALARELMEQVRSVPFEQAFARFNDDPSDDPDGAGTAPGGQLTQRQVYKLLGDRVEYSGGSVDSDRAKTSRIRIRFPTDPTTGLIREDLQDPLLGTPCDLNGDGVIDSQDHTSDALTLPVEVAVDFPTRKGVQRIRLQTLLGRR